MSIKLSEILPEPRNVGDGVSGEVTRDPWFRGHTNDEDAEARGDDGGREAGAADYGDGGAFPEVHIAQFPLAMGMEVGKGGNSKTLALQYDKDGVLRHDAIARLGHDKDKIVHARIQNTKPRFINKDDELLQKPTEEQTLETIERTKQALEKITKAKIAAALPVQHAQKVAPAEYIRYTPSQQSTAGESQQRIIRVVEAQKDPMEPPRFKINGKIPRAPPSPPAPVMHSPPSQSDDEGEADWKIPPCISNWKNPRGYTRLAADGRGLQQTRINENFAKFSEALQLAARTAREGVEARSEMERRVAKNQEEKRMVELARGARQANAGGRADETAEEREEREKRDEFRREHLEDIRRERNMARGRPDALEKLKKDQERDISEKIALGLPGVKQKSNETQFDSRLFNQDAGLDSGGIDDETYSVYSKAWRPQDNIQQSIYRPRQQAEDPYGNDLDEIVRTNRFVPARGFQGAEPVAGAAPRAAPVEFEAEREDIFGIGELFQTSRKDPPAASNGGGGGPPGNRRDFRSWSGDSSLRRARCERKSRPPGNRPAKLGRRSGQSVHDPQRPLHRSIDGQIARRFPSQRSMLGTMLDPVADKFLISTLFVTLAYVHLIPLSLTAVVFARDFLLLGGAFRHRFRTLQPPRTFRRYFNPSVSSIEIRPTLASKLNTVLQLATVTFSLAAPVFDFARTTRFCRLFG
ncbi:SKP-1 protein [Aphelenchoides fujianensis]|nr:SKP-1 protein [Aphelenchoides fujianensis]